MKERIAAFFVPPLTALVLLYQVLTDLQIAVVRDATLLVIGTTFAISVAVGLVAALGPSLLRVAVLAASSLVLVDVTAHLPDVFARLAPESRVLVARDTQRLADLHVIRNALEQYVSRIGFLPTPQEYGEATGPVSFWQNWWDLSSHDGNGDGRPFLEFLADEGVLARVPVDPVNQSASRDDPREGLQYVYFLVPPHYQYAGGTCSADSDRWTYLVGIRHLEYQTAGPHTRVSGAGCECLWRDQPDFFAQFFDYTLCGSFQRAPA